MPAKQFGSFVGAGAGSGSEGDRLGLSVRRFISRLLRSSTTGAIVLKLQFAAEAADAAEDKAFGADKRDDEMPDWVADKQARLARIRQAKAELEAEARAKAADEQAVRKKNDDKPRPGRKSSAALGCTGSEGAAQLH